MHDVIIPKVCPLNLFSDCDNLSGKKIKQVSTVKPVENGRSKIDKTRPNSALDLRRM